MSKKMSRRLATEASKGVQSVKDKPSALAVKEAVMMSETTGVEEPEICIFKTRELLLKAQSLMREIEELLDCCTAMDFSNRRQCRTQECDASIEEDGETLVIEGFRFESATSRDDLKRRGSLAGAGARQGNT